MLADPKSDALSTRFGSQWLRLQDLEKIYPDALLFPYYDYKLGEALKKETELFFDSIVREDRSILDLLTADYTFVNERVARHYGIPNINGENFRRVTLADENRRGLLGQGSILALTSVADRTSPVLRGKWIMEVLLASPPPAPPPNVPTLDETKAESGDGMLTTRQRMEQHRANPQCNSCHRVIDPLGLALENFDVTGRWRIRDNGNLVDPVGDLYDGTKMTGPNGLRAALLKHQDMFFTQLHRAPDDLQPRPPRRVFRHARDSQDRPRRGEGQQPLLGVRAGSGEQPRVPDVARGRRHDDRRRQEPVDDFRSRISDCGIDCGLLIAD